VWFKTYRTAPEALDFEQVDDTDDASSNLWGLGVQLAAEPFAYGERVTLPTFTVKNDPAVANGCMAVLPEILGDAPAPARFDMVASATHQIPAPMFAVTPVSDSFSAPPLVQFGVGDSITPGTDMGAAVTDSFYSGGSYRPISFATDTGLVKRATVPISGVTPGRYAVMVRASRVNGSDSLAFQAIVNQRVPGPVVGVERPNANDFTLWLDLGTFAFPQGLSDSSATSMEDTTIDLLVQRVAGAGNGAPRRPHADAGRADRRRAGDAAHHPPGRPACCALRFPLGRRRRVLPGLQRGCRPSRATRRSLPASSPC
jgi:hypothetical protein